jgi:hypothetical protein
MLNVIRATRLFFCFATDFDVSPEFFLTITSIPRYTLPQLNIAKAVNENSKLAAGPQRAG